MALSHHLLPHEYDHTHSNVNSGWLRATVFGAMDGLVSNISLIAGIAATGAAPNLVALTGISGLLAGSLSMALGEYTSVKTQNEQLEREIQVEREALARNPRGEEFELREEFVKLGMSEETAKQAAAEVHSSGESALRVHLSHELGLSLDDHPSPLVAAISSFLAFTAGAIIPAFPYIIGAHELYWALLFGAFGLLLAGAFAAKFTGVSIWKGALRQLIVGCIAVSITFAIGSLFHLGSPL